jgi:hypothetical protein
MGQARFAPDSAQIAEALTCRLKCARPLPRLSLSPMATDEQTVAATDTSTTEAPMNRADRKRTSVAQAVSDHRFEGVRGHRCSLSGSPFEA